MSFCTLCNWTFNSGWTLTSRMVSAQTNKAMIVFSSKIVFEHSFRELPLAVLFTTLHLFLASVFDGFSCKASRLPTATEISFFVNNLWPFRIFFFLVNDVVDIFHSEIFTIYWTELPLFRFCIRLSKDQNVLNLSPQSLGLQSCNKSQIRTHILLKTYITIQSTKNNASVKNNLIMPIYVNDKVSLNINLCIN